MEWRTEWLDIVRQNLGYAWRAVRRSPGFSCAVVITLGLGIGANATMFGVVDRLLLRPPLHITNPEQVRLRRKSFLVTPGPQGFRGP